MQAAIDETMTNPPLNVRDDIAAYESMQSELEASYLGRWVLFYDRKFVDTFESFDDAAKVAVARFGKGPYLIRRIGSNSVTLPASVMYGPLHAINVLRV